MELSQELKVRGFISQFVGPDLATILDKEKRTIYHGIDPSADSAHAGNFVNWMFLKHLAEHGHRIIFLFGGGTGMIGDPKPDAERELKDQAIVANSVAKLRAQVERFFAGSEVDFVDNAEWLGELKLIDFLRDIGKHYTVNELVKKDAIANRLKSDNGLSYTEFAYPLLQGYDYYQLYRTKGCTLQIGGSDQWGNIVSGVELVRRKEKVEVYAITVPLVIDKATGKKFGKSEGNAVWLDREKTSPFMFYQFWLNTSDEAVIEHLKRFTLLSLEMIAETEEKHLADPAQRLAQRTLAKEVTGLVHGEEAARAAEQVSNILFGEQTLNGLSEEAKKIMCENVPHTKISSDVPLVEVLISTGLASSKREARGFILDGAVSVNGEKVEEVESVVKTINALSGLILLRRGKKHYHVLCVD